MTTKIATAVNAMRPVNAMMRKPLPLIRIRLNAPSSTVADRLRRRAQLTDNPPIAQAQTGITHGLARRRLSSRSRRQPTPCRQRPQRFRCDVRERAARAPHSADAAPRDAPSSSPAKGSLHPSGLALIGPLTGSQMRRHCLVPQSDTPAGDGVATSSARCLRTLWIWWAVGPQRPAFGGMEP